MKSLEGVLKDLVRGDVIKASYDCNQEQYNGCRIRYDGEVATEVDGLLVDNFFVSLPEIGIQLQLGNVFQIQYDRIRKVYQNIILVREENHQLCNGFWIAPIYGFYDESSDLYEGITMLNSRLKYDTTPAQIQRQKIRGMR